MASNNKSNIQESTKYSKEAIQKAIATAAMQYNVPVELALGLAKAESNFNPNAKSKAGAIGVMQLMPDTAKGLGVNPFNVLENIRGGVRYLAQQLERYKGDTTKAVAAYNAGPGAVDKYNGVPPYKETQNYVKTVSDNTKMFSSEDFKGFLADAQKESQQASQSMQKKLATDYIAALNDAQKRYDWEGVDRVTKSYIDQYNNVIKELRAAYPQASLEEIKEAGDRYLNQISGIKDFGSKTIEQLRADNAKNMLVDPIVNENDRRSIELQNQLREANPYTRMAQIAPLNLDAYAQAVAQQQAAEDYANNKRGVFAALDFMDPNVKDKSKIVTRDFAAEAQRRADLAQQLALAQQAAQMARQTGLAPEQFLTGATSDYNTLMKLGNDRNTAAANLNQAYVQNVVPNLNRDIVNTNNATLQAQIEMAQRAQAAEEALIKMNQEKQKQEVEVAKQGLSNLENLYNTGLTGYNQQGTANTYVVPGIYGPTVNAETSRQNNIENNYTKQQNTYMDAATGQNQGGSSGQNINPITGGNSMINGGVYTNNASLINAGIVNNMRAMGYRDEDIAKILQQGSGTVNPNVLPFMPYPGQFNQGQ